MKSYHNTTAYQGQTLIDFDRSARTQDNEILDFLRHNDKTSFTAYEIEQRFQGKMLITSIRRALTNLCKAGKIAETGYRNERFGKRNTTYQSK